MRIQHNASLKEYTSLHAGGNAEELIELDSNDSLKECVEKAQKPVWVLGYGTNVLISDKGLSGTVILNQSGKVEILENRQVYADSGANWDDLIQKAIASNLSGLEFTSGVPGGVGAAITGNIAAYGHQIADCFLQAEILDTESGEISAWSKESFEFTYRASSLQKPENKKFVILSALFQLQSQIETELRYESALKTAQEMDLRPDSLENRRRIILETRRKAGSLLSNNKVGPWTAGSFFKNPLVNEEQVQAIVAHEEAALSKDQLLRQNIIHGGDKARVSAAHVLLAAGFNRGQTWGNVRLHPDHILKIENMGNASAQEIYDVVQNIVATVKEKLNITLEPEVRFLGDFS